MPYFDSFPTISYDPTGDKNPKTIKDILTRINIKQSIKDSGANFEVYDIQDGDTPELVAHKEYGDSRLHWVILLFNDILNPYYDWPLSVRNFEKFVKNKYTEPDASHHYEVAQSSGITTKMITVESSVVGSTSVSNYQYEATLNDKRKQIKLLKPEFVAQLSAEFNKELAALEDG